MCGIAGFLEFQANSLSKGNPQVLLNNMLSTIKHRGPDDQGMSFYGYDALQVSSNAPHTSWQRESETKLALGHQRLSIIDLSSQGRQPMKNTKKSLEIIFNGEIYNYKELKRQLTLNYTFTTATDTEVLLAAYQCWGKHMLKHLDGMYAFVIWDKEKQELFCARDPMGIKPFYYYLDKEYFIFGSEPKVVLEALGTSGHIDIASAAEFLTMGVTDHSESTFYKEVKQLNGAHFLSIKTTGEIQIRNYWKPPKLASDASTDYIADYKSIALETITRQLRADVAIGTSLSGGIDSTTIVALASKILGQSSKNYNTLTFTFPDFDNDESVFAKEMSQHTQMTWHAVEPGLDTLAQDVEHMMLAMGEPFSTLSMFAQFKVMEYAQKIGLKVMLDGQGGDEIYLGYPRVAQFVVSHYFSHFKWGAMQKEWKGLHHNASMPYWYALMGNIFFSSPSIAIHRNKKNLSKFVEQEFLDQYRKDIAHDVYAPTHIINKQNKELTRYCLPRLLRYADRNAMHFGVELRVPHLGQEIVDFALAVPLKYRVYHGWTKYMVRKAMEGTIPASILWSNKKRGFDIPQGYWVKVLTPKIKEWLSDNPLSESFKTDEILKEVEQGNAHAHYLWRVISLIAWAKLTNVKT